MVPERPCPSPPKCTELFVAVRRASGLLPPEAPALKEAAGILAGRGHQGSTLRRGLGDTF